jgi:hypothetical protein
MKKLATISVTPLLGRKLKKIKQADSAPFSPKPGFWERNFSDSSFDPTLVVGPPFSYGSREIEREELKRYKRMHSEVGKSLVSGKRKKGVRKCIERKNKE